MVAPTVFAATTEKPKSCRWASTAEGGYLVDHVEVHSSDAIIVSGNSMDAIAFASRVLGVLLLLKSMKVSVLSNARAATLFGYARSMFMELRTKIQDMTIETQLKRRRTRRLQSIRD